MTVVALRLSMLTVPPVMYSPATEALPEPLLAALFMGLCGFFTEASVLLVQRLLAGRPDANTLNARDPHGRTPLHVATFARQREAVAHGLRLGPQARAQVRGRAGHERGERRVHHNFDDGVGEPSDLDDLGAQCPGHGLEHRGAINISLRNAETFSAPMRPPV